MFIFFFSIGLEIKREILVGELSSFKQALLPIVGAIGGMVVPVLLYYLLAKILLLILNTEPRRSKPNRSAAYIRRLSSIWVE